MGSSGRTWIFVLSIASSIAVIGGGCGSNGGASSPPGPAPGATTSATIGPAGGKLASADGDLVVDVPADALPAPIELTLTTASGPPGAVGAIYEVGPSGTEFAVPITLTFKQTPGAEEAHVSTAIDGRWRPLSYGWRTDSEIAGLTTHLSLYARTLPEECSCGVAAHEKCCDEVIGSYVSGEPDDAGRSRFCACTFGDTGRYPRTWQYYDCIKQDLSPQLACTRAPELETCCRNQGGYIVLSSFNACICSAPGKCALSKDKLPPPIDAPCENGYRHGGFGPSDAGTAKDADASCTCTSYSDAINVAPDLPSFTVPVCFDVENKVVPNADSGTCRACTCDLAGACLTEWRGITDEQSRKGLLVEDCYLTNQPDCAKWTCP